jgi:hypothetical protein
MPVLSLQRGLLLLILSVQTHGARAVRDSLAQKHLRDKSYKADLDIDKNIDASWQRKSKAAHEDQQADPEPSERKIIMQGRWAIDLEAALKGVERAISRDVKADGDPSNRKVAFLFLLMDGLDNEDIWDSFFQGADVNKFSVYTHRAKPQNQTTPPLSKWGAVRVPHVPSGWCALSGLEMALFAEALADTSNAQFVLVSSSTVPLKPFSYVYSQLIESSPSTSKICYASKPSLSSNPIVESLLNEVNGFRSNRCHYRDYYSMHNPRMMKHHQWVVLSRKHAFTVVTKAEQALEEYQRTWQRSAKELGRHPEGCSDEASVSVALLLDKAAQDSQNGVTSVSDDTVRAELKDVGVEQSCLTWVHWRSCFVGTPLDLSAGMFANISRVLQSGAPWHIAGAIAGQQDKSGRTEYQKKVEKALNGFPTFFGPARNSDPTLSYLVRLVTEEPFMFGRKFDNGCKVQLDGHESGLPAKYALLQTPAKDRVELGMVLPKLWSSVDPEKVASRVWTRLDSDGEPSSK